MSALLKQVKKILPPAIATQLRTMRDRRRVQAALDQARADKSHTGELDVALRHPRSVEEYRETLRQVRGRVDALSTLILSIIFLLVVFVLAQFFLGQDRKSVV